MILNNKFHKPLVLASTSRYRAELLGRLMLTFTTIAPKTDEAALLGESCEALAKRLSIAKAVAGARACGLEDGLVIGSDQVADLNGVALGKPGNVENAMKQLQQMRGQTVIFHTALSLHDVASGRVQSAVVPTTVVMRDYTDSEITYYLAHENALDCAGSAKSEGLGAALIARMSSDDPTALVGLPLLALCRMLHNEGLQVLT
jgi:septum formation protein